MGSLADLYLRVRPDMTGFGTELVRGGETAGGQAADRASGVLNKRLRALKLPSINLSADPTAALAQMGHVRDRLEDLKRDAGTIALRIKANQAIGDLDRIKKRAGLAGDDSGTRFTTRIAAVLPGGISAAITAGGPGVATAVVGVAATAAAVLAPAIGAAVSAGILLGVGGGVLALGIRQAMKDPAVSKAWQGFAERGQSVLTKFGEAFKGPLIRAASTFSGALARMGPTIASMGKTMAPVIDKLAPAIAQMAEKALPGIKSALEQSVPLFEVLAEHAPKIGEAVSSFFSMIGKSGPGAAKLLGDVLTFVEGSIATTGAVLFGLSKAYEVIRGGIVAVFHVISAVISGFAGWWSGTIVPSVKRALDQLGLAWRVLRGTVSGVFGAIRGVLAGGWRFIRDQVFAPLSNFITKTIPKAFGTGTAAIGRIWDGVKALARKPVEFIVNTVINHGVIDTFNKVSGFFGGPKLGHISFGGAAGAGPQRGGFHGFDGPGVDDGSGDGPGLLGMFRSPAKWVSDRVGLGRLAERFGNHPFVQVLTALGGKLRGLLVDKVLSLIDAIGSSGGGSVGAGGLRSGILGVLGSLRGAFGSVPLISGLRPGARTLTGNRSYHASGRAIDIAPVHAWAAFLNSSFGGRLRELITPWQELNILNGRPHRYTGAVWQQHNFAGGNAHIHAAMDAGGYLQPGWNGPIYNGTGRPEPVTTASSMDDVIGELRGLRRMHPKDIAALAEALGRVVVGAFGAASYATGHTAYTLSRGG